MCELSDLLLTSYDFSLDQNLIAQTPIEPRHSSKLLIVEEASSNINACSHSHVWNFKEDLCSGDLLVINNTRVLKARLIVSRRGGGKTELLLIEPRGEGKWLCLARPAKRIHIGDSLCLRAKSMKEMFIKVVGIDIPTGGRIIQFPSCFADRESIEPFLNDFGEVPLPPYIERNDLIDPDRYQTRYADCPGAVAAPTAGLHLSDELIEELEKKGVLFARITLHVGLGTFRPIDIEDLTKLQLHSEWVEVTAEVVSAVKSCRARGGRVIAVGTTSVRALEGAFCAGGGSLQPMQGPVDLIIRPGYKFGVVDGLLTNFHLPKSSLLLLVSALIGRKKLLALYAIAIEHQYRFFSYGDAMWIPPNATLPDVRPQAG